MNIDRSEEKDKNFREKFTDILLFFLIQSSDKSFGHDDRWIVTNDREDILYPLIDPFSDDRFNGLVIKCYGHIIDTHMELPMTRLAPLFHIVVTDNIRSRLVDEREGTDDDMRWNSGFEKRKNIRNNLVVFPGDDNFPQAEMQVIVIALSFFLVFSGFLDSGKRFCGFRLRGLRLLFRTTLGTALIPIKIIESIKSHK